MINNVLIDGKVSERIFKTEEEIIEYAETIEKECNIVIWNDNNNFMTNIQIFDRAAEHIIHEISFVNLRLKDENEQIDFSDIDFMF